VTSRPPAGEAGRWRFGPVNGTRPFDMTIAAGPYARAWSGTGGTGDAVRMSIWCRGSLAGTVPGPKGFERFAELARQALAYYERMLGVPCPYPKYDIGFVSRLDAQAISIPGLMLVSENLLTRMADPDDDFVAMLCAHEVSHLWFGCHISARWWDDLWLDEAMAMYVSCTAMAAARMGGPWTAFCYREEPRAYEADALRAGAERLHAPVRRRHREPGRPGRLLVPFVRAGSERLGAGVAAHRGGEHAAGGGDGWS
jgi:aminopeptidase N